MKISHKLQLFIVTVILFGSFSISLNAQDRIQFGDKDLWLNGGNIAWINFSSDVGPNSSTVDDFEPVFTQVNQNGGNALRFWVHINGSNTPAWSGGQVTGPGAGTIDDLRAILDAAWEKDIGLVLCLWSFDMLRESSGNTLTARNRNMLEDSTLTQAYIENALIPMVEELGDHPAIIAWEIFNEAEGMSKEFGWDNVTGSVEDRVAMFDIQRFTNMTAGAIHRTNADAVVSNGVWSFHALSETSNSNSKNYYSDEELISAGKDSLGTLDFYMVHYYEWGGTALSPFHNHADSWGLDKPIVVGEFGIPSGDLFGIPGSELYERLYDNGYAGALVWQWVDWYQDRGDYGDDWLRGLDQMLNMKLNYPGDISLGSTYPQITRFSAFPNEIAAGDSTRLNWQVNFADNVTLDGNPVAIVDTIFVSPSETTTYEIIASSDTTDVTDTASVTVEVVDPGQLNRAFGKKVVTSANEQGFGNEDPSAATDGDQSTRWSSPYQDDHWVYVDLGKAYTVNSVTLYWEVAYGESYDIQVSVDAQNWMTVYEERNGNGSVDEITLTEPAKGRYVRMKGINRATEFGYSLWEFEVRGLVSDNQPPSISLNEPRDGIRMRSGSSLYLQADVEESDSGTLVVSYYLDNELYAAVSESPFTMIVDNLEDGDYAVHAIAEDNEFTVQSATSLFTVESGLSSKRLEAEDAIASGTIEQTSASPILVSGGGLAIIKDSGSLIWHNVGLGNEENYTLKLRYNLPDGEKFQKLSINGEVTDTLYFEQIGSGWMSKDTVITSSEPIHTISIEHYMDNLNIDYIQLTVNQAVSNEDLVDVPLQIKLNQNYPNPFNPVTNISYTLPEGEITRLTVYDLAGRKIAELVNGYQSAGHHTVSLDASNMASGIYIYRLRTSRSTLSKKMLLVK